MGLSIGPQRDVDPARAPRRLRPRPGVQSLTYYEMDQGREDAGRLARSGGDRDWPS